MPGELKDVPVDIVAMLNVAFEASGIPQGSDINSYTRLAEFIKATPIKKCPLITPAGEIFLTTKELECLNLLAGGKNAKLIAQQVKVSNRTIEKHLENIKQKSGNKNKIEVIKYYKDSLTHWL